MERSSVGVGEEIAAGIRRTAPSFEEFYAAEHARLFGTLCLVSGDAREAEDLMQEAFLKLLERWEHVRSVADPQGYLFRTAFNLLRNRYRRTRRMARRLMGLLPEQQDCFSQIENRDLVARALRRLSPRQRAAIVLTQLVELRPEEAARLMGVTQATVRSLASQGRSAIRATMEESHE